ncbi:MAG TPA: patatin-like phospholipase family protein [Solirubrobacterales bacterium]|nr:patatin-like phospholipase family protein [Solirubrobacterales bacterium]
MSYTEFLRQVPVLAGLPDRLLDQVGKEAREHSLTAGDWLFHEGDDAESLFVIRSGRMEVVDEGPPETLIRVLRRGQVLGELALLQAGTRSASVRARRDSSLLELDRERFERLIHDEPAFAIGLTRTLGAQLAASRAPMSGVSPRQTIAVVPVSSSAPAAEVADLLSDGLAEAGRVGRLSENGDRTHSEMREALDTAEETEDHVLLVAGSCDMHDPWTAFCLGEADLILAITDGPPERAWLDQPFALHGCELIVLARSVDSECLVRVEPAQVQVIADRDQLPDRMMSTARRIAGRSVGVVLSGGGARAFAHLGVVEELVGAGIKVDRIGGVSLGSIVAAAIAIGLEPDAIMERFEAGFVQVNPTGDFTIPLFALIRGRRTRELLDRYYGEYRIEELERRFFCLSCDLIGREAVVHQAGNLADAVRASLSIPGVFPPIPTPDGRLLVDGGVIDNLPVATMAQTGEGPVIAVDVTGHQGAGFQAPTRPGLARYQGAMRRFLTGNEERIPRLGETIVRTVTVGSIDTIAAAEAHAALVIRPRVDGVGLLDWRRLDHVREAGREAAREALADLPESIR